MFTPPQWGRRRGPRWLPLLLIGLVGLLIGCVIGGGIGFVAGHVTGPGPGFRHGRMVGPYPGPRFEREPFPGPGWVTPAPATPSHS